MARPRYHPAAPRGNPVGNSGWSTPNVNGPPALAPTCTARAVRREVYKRPGPPSTRPRCLLLTPDARVSRAPALPSRSRAAPSVHRQLWTLWITLSSLLRAPSLVTQSVDSGLCSVRSWRPFSDFPSGSVLGTTASRYVFLEAGSPVAHLGQGPFLSRYFPTLCRPTTQAPQGAPATAAKPTIPTFNRKPRLCGLCVSAFCTFSTSVDSPVDNVYKHLQSRDHAP